MAPAGSMYSTVNDLGRDNGILVSELTNGKIHIQGTAVTGTASKINGQASRDFLVTGSLFVNFGAGNDRVEFSAVGPVIVSPRPSIRTSRWCWPSASGCPRSWHA